MKHNRLRDLREDHDLLQKEIAEKLKMTQQQYSLYETGVRDTPIAVLMTLAELYNTSIDYIVGRTDERKAYKKKQKVVS